MTHHQGHCPAALWPGLKSKLKLLLKVMGASCTVARGAMSPNALALAVVMAREVLFAEPLLLRTTWPLLVLVKKLSALPAGRLLTAVLSSVVFLS
jgi:hypothetical protein